MKLNIRDMLDGYVENNIEIGGKNGVSIEKIREVTMNKVNAADAPKHHVRRGTLIAAACIAALLLATTALACFGGWNGFALLDGLSRKEKSMLDKEASTAVAGEMIDAEGNHHYLGKDGEELFVLTEEENKAYVAEQQAAHDQAVRDSTALLNTDTLDSVPVSITELASDGSGGIPDFMLGNGHMVLLKHENDSGWCLNAGDTVTIRFASKYKYRLEFGLVKDTVMVETKTAQADEPVWTFTVPDGGTYYFTVLNISSGVSDLTDGTITVNGES